MLHNKKIYMFLIPLILICIMTNYVKAALLENNTHVFEDSDLIYYINIYYDGVDVEGIESNDTTLADIQSGYIYVEDKIPEGLIFNGFVETPDGTIGAIDRSDGTACQGKVIDGVDGLTYDETTRTVKFTVKNLKAGCMLTVGIKTKTPILSKDETRMDFYNTASATEGLITVLSNTVHAWIGREDTEELTKYNVVYEYTGAIPENAPSLPSTKEYLDGTMVGVEASPTSIGYIFLGWTTSDVEVTDGKFTMPANTVTFTGSFTEIPAYKVSYEINGIQPDGYVLPTTKEYYEGMMVTLDTLQVGDIINGYRFLGWTSNSVVISAENDFEMPDNDVVITGRFEKEKYNVIYMFQGDNLPNNENNLLPETKSYAPGETVTLEAYPEAEGYRFLGWYKEDNFIMPGEDVVIYGEWAVEIGQFEPTITYEIVNKKDYYKPGDIVTYKITVTNTADYELKDIIVQEKNEKLKFISGTGYEIESDQIAKISNISANESVSLYEEYTVLSSDKGSITSEVELIGALASGNYVLNTDNEYKESITISIKSILKLCNTVSGGNNSKVFLFRITGSEYESWAVLEKNVCKTIYLAPGSYRILEVEPQDYTLTNVYGDLTANNGKITIELGKDYEVTFNNTYERKGFYHSFGRIVNIIKNVINE